MTRGRLNSTDVVVLGELRRLTKGRGRSELSTRQFYERSGIGRKTVQKSLSRLADAGQAQRVRASSGGASAHWIALPAEGWNVGDDCIDVAPIDPGKVRGEGIDIVPDAFRRSDLRSPWLLYCRLPSKCLLTLDEAVELSELSSRRRTVEWWLLVLASMLPPLVIASSAERDCLWTKVSVDQDGLDRIAAHLSDVASAGCRRPIHTTEHAQLANQLERENNLWHREARRG